MADKIQRSGSSPRITGEVPAQVRSSEAPAAAPAPSDGFGKPQARDAQAHRLGATGDHSWWGGRPLSEGHNAHRTNTKEQFEAALKSDANWFEGDVRLEIDKTGIEMRHDPGHETGDNLTLHEWLTMGKASGRGLKLDVKEPDQMPGILAEIERVGIPQERLMINLGYGSMEKWGAEIRRRFPSAILALNPPTNSPLTQADAEKMVAQAKKFGGPVTFVCNQDQVTPAAVRAFLPAGTISVWGHADDPAKRGAELRELGVNGMIDLAPPEHLTPGKVVDAGLNWFKTKLDKAF